MNIPDFGKNVWNFNVFRSVVLLNEYKLPIGKNLRNLKVIDVGGHVGAFSWLCASLKVKEVFYCEVDKENYELGVKILNDSFNLWKKGKTIFVLFNMAIWKNDCRNYLPYQKSSDPNNTGGGSVISYNESNLVPCFPFDEIIKLRLNKNTDKKEKVLLKLDCEGSEFPILFESKELEHIDYICGEYHEINKNIPEYAKVEGFESFDALTLQKFLKEQGFLYTFFDRNIVEGNKLPLGHFWASRTKQSFFEGIKLSEESQQEI